MLLQKYTSIWTKNFTAIKSEIESALIGFNYTIEHVGSTSVPNLAAKPIRLSVGVSPTEILQNYFKFHRKNLTCNVVPTIYNEL